MGGISALLRLRRLERKTVDISHITLVFLIKKEITGIFIGAAVVALRIIGHDPPTP
jgi:hypothetical protein